MTYSKFFDLMFMQFVLSYVQYNKHECPMSNLMITNELYHKGYHNWHSVTLCTRFHEEILFRKLSEMLHFVIIFVIIIENASK